MTRQTGKYLSVYVLLIRTSSAFSRIIHLLTGSEYTHASIGLNKNCRELYSFARKYAALPLPAGLVTERINAGLMGKNRNGPCALYEIRVTREVYGRLTEELGAMLRHRKRYGYSLSGPLMCLINHARSRRHRFFCSQFVAHLLSRSGAIKLDKPSSLYRPSDFTTQPELRLCYKGTIGALIELTARPQHADSAAG